MYAESLLLCTPKRGCVPQSVPPSKQFSMIKSHKSFELDLYSPSRVFVPHLRNFKTRLSLSLLLLAIDPFEYFLMQKCNGRGIAQLFLSTYVLSDLEFIPRIMYYSGTTLEKTQLVLGKGFLYKFQ